MMTDIKRALDDLARITNSKEIANASKTTIRDFPNLEKSLFRILFYFILSETARQPVKIFQCFFQSFKRQKLPIIKFGMDGRRNPPIKNVLKGMVT